MVVDKEGRTKQHQEEIGKTRNEIPTNTQYFGMIEQITNLLAHRCQIEDSYFFFQIHLVYDICSVMFNFVLAKK